MTLAFQIIVALVALEHIYILWFEMFAWTTRGPKVFRSLPKELFPQTKVLAANQGLYNGLLAAGLIWSLLIEDAQWAENIGAFFLGCVLVAALYGGYSASRKIWIIQGVLPLIGLLLFLFKTMQ